MKHEESYKPDWISETEACNWIGVNKCTLYRWRNSKGIAWTSINGRAVMYDRKDLQRLLNQNSTYQLQGVKLETA